MRYKPKSKKWFMDRIGKIIYRDYNDCSCNHCEQVLKNGLIIYDEQHAGYLADVDNEFASDGCFMNYRDEK